VVCFVGIVTISSNISFNYWTIWIKDKNKFG